ncbi:2-dehydropantoate 2-reductase [Bacillus sp. AK128]
MNIGIIGGGAIGLLFGGYLAAKHHVTLYTRTLEQAKLIKDHGILIHREGLESKVTLNAVCVKDGIAEHDLIIVTVKQYHLSSLIPILSKISVSTRLLFLQNGMSHIEFISRLPQTNILVGVIEHGALKLNQHSVKHTGMGVTRVSTLVGDELFIKILVDSCSSSLFPIEKANDWYNMLINKLVVNTMINPLTAILRVENGQLLSNPHFHQLFSNLYLEVIALLSPEEPRIWWDSVISICNKTAKNRSSMLRDIEQGNVTEVEGILGYYRTLPIYQHTNTPMLDFLYDALKGLEK